MKNIFLVLFILLGQEVLAQENLSKTVSEIDDYLTNQLEEWNIPGAALAIVKDGKIIHEKGYGVKNIETGEKVDEHTLFAIASNTKAYTAAALAQLVDKGKISWDDKVKTHLPYFELYDAYVSEQMTIQDLLCHRSGLKTFSGDLLWYGSEYSREEVIKRAKHLGQSYDFRTEYGYQNIMFIAAGEIVAKVSGMSWDEYVKTNFFNKLGMDNTITSIREFTDNSNKSEPHNEKDGKVYPIEWVNWDNIGGAGAIISSAHDASQWLKLQLNNGTIGEEKFWSEEQSHAMWTVKTPKRLSNWHRTNFPSKHFSGYGLGWDLYDYHGKLIVNHGGGYDGFISHSVLVPEEKLGFIIMVNGNVSIPYAMMYQILDAFIAPDSYVPVDWGNMFLEYKKQGDKDDKQSALNLEEARIKNTTPSIKAAKLAGVYNDIMYGDLTISEKKGEIKFKFNHSPIFHGYLEHWQDDTYRLHWSTNMMLPSGMAKFHINDQNEIEKLIIDVPNPDFDFTEFTFTRKEQQLKPKNK